MKRKLIIGIALALMVGVVILVLAPGKNSAAAIIAFHSVAEQDEATVLFAFTTASNNKHFNIFTMQQSNGLWRLAPDVPLRSLTTSNGYFTLPCVVPKTTNVWRLAGLYEVIPRDSFIVRQRKNLAALAARHKWFRLTQWLHPTMVQGIYGPAMLGNKPVAEN